jgi:hypothetical protein
MLRGALTAAMLVATPAAAAEPDMWVLGWHADGLAPVESEACWSSYEAYRAGSVMQSAIEDDFNLVCDTRIWCDGDVGLGFVAIEEETGRKIGALSLVSKPAEGPLTEICREPF